MKGPELEIEFSAYYNEKKEKFNEGGLYPFLEYCQQSKPKDVMVRIDYDNPFEEIDVYCESLGISKLSYEKTDGHDSNFIARFTCDSKSGKPIMKVIYGLGEAGNGGHSYGFIVGDKKFYFDGDGADRIMKINGVKFHSIKNTYDLGGVWNDTTRKDNEESNNDIMSKNVVKINESQLKQVIAESVKKVLMESLPSLPGYDRWKTSTPREFDAPNLVSEEDFYDMVRSADDEQTNEFIEWLKQVPEEYEAVMKEMKSGNQDNVFLAAIDSGINWKDIASEVFDLKPVKYYPGDINEDKKKVKLTESKLKEIIKGSVKKVMNEISSDMIARAERKFHQKYGGTDFPKPDAKDFPKDKYGNLLYPKDMKPLADHYRNFSQAYQKAKREEQFNDPTTKEAMQIWNEVENDVDWEISDDFGNEGCEVMGYIEVNGWKFEATGYAERAGGLEVEEIEEVNFKSPDGKEGSFRP